MQKSAISSAGFPERIRTRRALVDGPKTLGRTSGGNFFTTWNAASGAICWALFRGVAERTIDAGNVRVRDSGCDRVAPQFRRMELMLAVVAANNYFTGQRITCAQRNCLSLSGRQQPSPRATPKGRTSRPEQFEFLPGSQRQDVLRIFLFTMMRVTQKM